MGTSFEKVIDIAIITIRDYRLDKLFNEDEESFIEVMSAYLVRAIPKFAPSCLKSLDYDIDTKEFVNELDMCEIDILADWTGYMWALDVHQDVLELKTALNNSDFKKLEAPAMLKARTAYLEYIRRKIKTDTNNYMFQYVDSFFEGGE